MNNRFFHTVVPLLTALLLSACGGGGGDSGGSGGFAVSPVAGLPAGTSGAQAPAGNGTGGGSGTGSGGTAAGDGGGTSTAAAGDDGSGVGSGGTGVSSASAVGIGSADGFGSVIVNGIRYDTDTAVFRVEDGPGLRLGTSLKVTGRVNSDQKTGTATLIESALELRGVVSRVDPAGGSFEVLGTTVTTDTETVWADFGGLAGVTQGASLQVWGLPAAPGTLRATRVERAASNAAPVLSGTVQNLNTSAGVFTLGTQLVSYATATFAGGQSAATLANGAIVRVRAASVGGSPALAATVVQNWYPVPQTAGTRIDLNGLVTDFTGLGGFRVLGVAVDATGAQVTGGQGRNIGNGVKVEVGGLLVNGVLRVTKLKIRNIPGTGGPSSFTLVGTVGAFTSVARFSVQGQPVDASGAAVAFVNGSAANLRSGAKVTVTGSRVSNGVLQAEAVTFD